MFARDVSYPLRPMIDPRHLRLDDQLCFSLYAATHAVTRAYRPLLGRLGLTYPQYLVMLVLWQDGSRTSGDIGRRLALRQNAITPLLDRLEAAGLLLRRRSGEDRRVVHVHLTPAGIDLETAVAQAQQAVECRTGLAPEGLGRLRGELAALARRMAELEHGNRESGPNRNHSPDNPCGPGATTGKAFA